MTRPDSTRPPLARPQITITKPAAAGVSIASNAILIALKLAAAAITGSIAILSEALHSMIDLIASVIAFVARRLSPGGAADMLAAACWLQRVETLT